MKLTKGKKIALISFAAFLVFMAVCTVAAKGIYASGLPRVSTAKPYSGSLAHVITVNGTVMQGQEYGVYVESGLRVDTVAVGNGDAFLAGQELFRIETGDLAEMIRQRRLETAKLEVQMAAAVKDADSSRQARKREAARAREDYDRKALLADEQILVCQQAYDAAQKALALYDGYLAESGQETDGDDPPGGTGDVSGNAQEAAAEIGGSEATLDGRLHELSSGGMGPEQNYTRQEKRLQLEQDVVKAAQALEEAMRQKEDSLRDAARLMEDANAALDAAETEINALALDITYQKEGLQKLEALLEADGWVYAENPGRVTRCSLEVGERTQDGACIVYAMDDGERILSATFSESQSRHIAVGTRFEMKATMPDGGRETGEALVEYLEKGQDGTVQARLSFELQEMALGQAAELTYRMQTESYSTCISQECVYREGENNYYVYVVEEREGILGTEWKVRRVSVRILDENDTAAAVQSAEITGDTRIISATDKALKDGDTVRVVQ